MTRSMQQAFALLISCCAVWVFYQTLGAALHDQEMIRKDVMRETVIHVGPPAPPQMREGRAPADLGCDEYSRPLPLGGGMRSRNQGSEAVSAPKLTAKVGAYSSVVGTAVHIHEGEAFAGQIAFMCQSDTLRDKALQEAMSAMIAAALNQFFKELSK